MGNALWISWKRLRRNQSLSRRFGARLHEFESPHKGLRRYLECLRRTVRLLHAHRPDVLFVPNPSIVLTAFAVTFGRIWASTVVVDAHNAGLFPLEGRSRALNLLCRTVLRLADTVIVSNAELQRRAKLRNTVILPDPFPDWEARPGAGAAARNGSGRHVVTYVTSWHAGEPYQEVMEAARKLESSGVTVYATGTPPAVVRTADKPANFVATGFLSDAAYLRQLRDSDIVLVLTHREACLTCGAYEALALGKPLILSDKEALRLYFGQGARYAQNTASALAEAVAAGRRDLDHRGAAAVATRHRLEHEWTALFARATAAIGMHPDPAQASPLYGARTEQTPGR